MSNVNLVYAGIDPGSKTGVALIYHDLKQITNVFTYTIDISKCKTKTDDYRDKLLKYKYLKDNLLEIFKDHGVNACAREEVFKGRFANAHAELTRLAYAIDDMVMDYNPLMSFFTYAPKSVKSSFSKKGDANKDDMRSALITHPQLSTFYNDAMSEHEVDALAIAYLLLEDLS